MGRIDPFGQRVASSTYEGGSVRPPPASATRPGDEVHGDALAIGLLLGLDVHLRMFTGDIERRASDIHTTASRFPSGHDLRAEVSAGKAYLREEHGLAVDLSSDPPYPWAVGIPNPLVNARRVPGDLGGGNPALYAFGLDGRQ